jgi:Kef-type K+ transport system membrane component KefB
MIGFLLGGELTRESLRAHGRSIVVVSISKVLGSFACVMLGLLAIGARYDVAMILAAASTATAPAATVDVLRTDGASGPFTRTLLGIVAVDDAWGLIVFGLALAVAEAVAGAGVGGALSVAIHEMGGALLLGLALGAPAALLTGRIAPGEPTQAEALSLVFLCAGLALWLEVSFLLAAMVMGATVSNVARHHRRTFRAIEGIEWPFLILFFALAGASLELRTLQSAFGLVIAYVVLRGLGTWIGCTVGIRAARDPSLGEPARRWMGMALMPQAGVALGMALVASQRVPDIAGDLLPVIVASTALLELGGPVLTRLSLRRVGESGRIPPDPDGVEPPTEDRT